MNPIKNNYRLTCETYIIASLAVELDEYINPYETHNWGEIEEIHEFIDDLRGGNFRRWLDTFAELREENEDDSEALKLIDELADHLASFIVDYTQYIESDRH